MDNVIPFGADPDRAFAPLNRPDNGEVSSNPDADLWEPLAPTCCPEMPRNASAMWVYPDPDGRALCARVRFNLADGGKNILPYSFGRRRWSDKNGVRRDEIRWHFKEPAKPLPLYGLHFLALNPELPVLLVEGEKTAEAAAMLFPDHVVVTSQGGSKASAKTDWSPLYGRTVTIWPDADDAGASYADAVIPLLRDAAASFVKLVTLPRDLPEGWDLADDLPLQLRASDGAATVLREILEDAVPASSNVDMPPTFRITATGLHFCREAKGEGSPTEPVFVCGPVEVVAETNDGSGTAWGVLLRWEDRDGRTHQWAVPRRLIHGDGKEIAGELEDAGLACGVLGVSYLKQFIGSVRTKRRLRCVDRTGWHKTTDGHVFILPGGHTFGSGARDVVFQSARAATGREFATSGTLADWQRDVATIAVGNFRLGLALSASFAGPLLDVGGEPSGGVHYVGRSQIGKTTFMQVAGSVWGKGDRDGQVRQWRGTANGLEGIAAETSDTVLILDEMGQADARDVGEAIYMLSNSRGKQRAGRAGEARQPKTWRTLFLSTGEITLSAKLAEVGRKTMAGQEVRLINLPADAGAGMGVFQDLHGFPSPGSLVEHLRDAARTFYGSAARAYLTALVRARTDDPDAIATLLKTIRARFIADFVPEGADGQVGSVAARFALIAAAGELARHYGVLPWPQGEALRAAGHCFKAWLDQRGGIAAGEDEQSIAQVRAFIEAHGESRFTVLGNPDPGLPDLRQPIESRTINRAGFRRRTGGTGDERWEFLVLSETWRNEVCKGIDPVATAKVLAAKGLLRRGSDAHLAARVRVPDHGNTRVYVIAAAILDGDCV